MSGSLFFWGKILYNQMLELSFEIWVCEVPIAGANSTNVTAARLLQDPSIICDGRSDSPWAGLLTASIFIFILFGLAFPAFSFFVVESVGRESRAKEEEFRVRYGTLYAAFDEDSFWWYIGPVTFRVSTAPVKLVSISSPNLRPTCFGFLRFEQRLMLQLFAVSVQRFPVTLAGLAIAVHTIYGFGLVGLLPYADPAEDVDDQSSSMFDDLDALAVLQTVIQVIILILGLAANESNAATMTVLVVLFYLIGAVASFYVFMRVSLFLNTQGLILTLIYFPLDPLGSEPQAKEAQGR
jgi:hypothetical protein